MTLEKQDKKALVLFARDPVQGKVKTRLGSLFDPETTLQLYVCFLRDSIENLCAVRDTDRFIGVYPSSESGFFADLERENAVTVFPQEGTDLGERMRNTISRLMGQGYGTVVIIGADSPTLPVAYIETALRSNSDVVIGPSTDHGYYLVGMSGGVTEIFAGVAWGTDRVLDETLGKIRAAGARLELLPVWYDIDRPEDLRFLKTHLDLIMESRLNGARNTWEFLSQPGRLNDK